MRRLICAVAVVATMALPHAQTPRYDAAALVKDAVAALESERFADALEGFTRAAKILPNDATVCLGAGIAAARLGRNDEAETWLERALKLQPTYTTASEWLGELQYRAGRVKDAIATYEAALKSARDPKDLERRLADWRKETQLQDRFYESRGAHFVVLFEGPADESLARSVVERLEQAYWRVGGVLTAYPPKPITVVLYTSEQFTDITRSPAWSGGVYDGRIRVPIKGALADVDDLDRVLSHEFVHAVVAMLGGRTVPVWVNEGLAVTLETSDKSRVDAEFDRTRSRPALQSLHGGFGRLPAADARVAYAVSAHAVKRMLELRGPYAVVALMQDLARGSEFSAAFQQHFAMRYADFQAMVARD